MRDFLAIGQIFDICNTRVGACGNDGEIDVVARAERDVVEDDGDFGPPLMPGLILDDVVFDEGKQTRLEDRGWAARSAVDTDPDGGAR